MSANYNEPIIHKRRTGRSDDPFIEISETLRLDSNAKAILSELPNQYKRVVVTGDNKDWFEIEEGELEENQYKVDYNNKIVTFHISNAGKQLTFSYLGEGLTYVPSSMIYTDAEDGEIVTTLDEHIENFQNEYNNAVQLNAQMQANENTRKSNENTRIANEQTRQNQENLRQTNTTNAINNLNAVVNDIKTRWLTPVNTFSDISTTYPNPQHGDTVMTTGDGKIYRYVSGSGWQLTQQYNSTALNNLANELSKQNQQSTTIGHGLNVINATENSPLDIRIEGRTLVNVSQNVLDPAKYYVLADKKSKVKFSDGATYAGVAKFTGRAEKPILIRVANFEGKVAGSTLENPHVFKNNWERLSTSLLAPTDSKFKEDTQNGYNSLYKLDGSLASSKNPSSGGIAQQLMSFNLIEAIERNDGKIPANDTAGKVAWLKNNIARLTCNWWGYGQSPSGNKANFVNWRNDTSTWNTPATHSSASVTKLTQTIDTNIVSLRIDADGFVHFIAYADPSDGTTPSAINTDYVELEIELVPGAILHAPKVPLYEVTQDEYNNILVSWLEDDVLRRYPQVKGVQHVQNPYVMAEGENLLPPFTEWTLHANARVKSPYELELNATGTDQSSSVIINVIGGQTYTVSFSGNMLLVIYVLNDDGSLGTQLKYSGEPSPKTFAVPTTCKKIILFATNLNNTSGTFTLTNPMLTLGSTAKPFVPRNPSYLFAEVKLGALSDKKDILFKDGQDWKVTKWVEKDVVLDGKLSWSFMGDYTGYKRFNYTGLSNTLPNINENFVLTKFDGKKLKFRPDSNWQTDESYCFNNTVSISISDTYTGFGEHYKPSQQEIQAYFNGWKANGYTTGTAVTNELTGQLASNGTYTFAQSGAYRNVVVEKSTDGSTWSPATENIDFKIDISGTKAVLTNLSLSPMYFRISYNYGVTVNSWASLVDGSAPATNTLAYVSANMAPGFTPYKLSYVLATPQTIVVTDKVEGDIVVNGATQVEVGSGVIVREKANPIADKWSPNYYAINTTDSANYTTTTNSFLKNRTDKIINVYKNGVIDSKWKLDTSFGNGKMRAYIAKADYDPTAEYSATYMLLDRQSFTTNILSVTATYNSSLKSVVDDVVAKVSDNATQISIQARLLYDILKRLKAGGL